jgi:protein TonB
VNTIRRASAAIASVAILFSAATLAARADERSAIALTSSVPPALTPAHLKAPLYSQVPAFAQLAGLHGDAVVKIDLDERGRLMDAAIVRSSGNALLDRAAIATARSGAYSPASLAGTPVAGSFELVVDFAPGA